MARYLRCSVEQSPKKGQDYFERKLAIVPMRTIP